MLIVLHDMPCDDLCCVSYTEGVDYVVTPDPDQFISDILFMSTDPVTVNVTLLSDGVGGEGSEEIGITLVQLSPVEEFRVLTRPTVTITVRDNDSMPKFKVLIVT